MAHLLRQILLPVMVAFREFPDIFKMEKQYLKVEPSMSGLLQIVARKEPDMFGTTSMWNLCYRAPGRMMETAEERKDMLSIYERLTDHHGAEAYELYLGETLSVQGDFDASDIYAHKAALL